MRAQLISKLQPTISLLLIPSSAGNLPSASASRLRLPHRATMDPRGTFAWLNAASSGSPARAKRIIAVALAATVALSWTVRLPTQARASHLAPRCGTPHLNRRAHPPATPRQTGLRGVPQGQRHQAPHGRARAARAGQALGDNALSETARRARNDGLGAGAQGTHKGGIM